jgi:hypothetical protein
MSSPINFGRTLFNSHLFRLPCKTLPLHSNQTISLLSRRTFSSSTSQQPKESLCPFKTVVDTLFPLGVSVGLVATIYDIKVLKNEQKVLLKKQDEILKATIDDIKVLKDEQKDLSKRLDQINAKQEEILKATRKS